MPRHSPNAETIRSVLMYDAETGIFAWRARPAEMFDSEFSCRMWNGQFAEQPALQCVSRNGYLYGSVGNIKVYAHRAAWAHVTGDWPVDTIDHINGIKTDNRFLNLRDVTVAENRRNMPRLARNTSGAAGVKRRSDCARWEARIQVFGRSIHLGLFETFDEAYSKRKQAEALYGFHPNHGMALMDGVFWVMSLPLALFAAVCLMVIIFGGDDHDDEFWP